MAKGNYYSILYILSFYLFLTERAMFTMIVPILSTILLAVIFRFILLSKSGLVFIKNEVQMRPSKLYLVSSFFTLSVFIHYRGLVAFLFEDKLSAFYQSNLSFGIALLICLIGALVLRLRLNALAIVK